jgi:hypothetical protein
MRATSSQAGNSRKGVILLVVLAMITLLTVLGITFVLYSDASEATARINMEGERTAFQLNPVDYPAYELMQHGFGQLVFGVEDDEIGQQSALRGHDLARDMYGYRYTGVAQETADLEKDTPVQTSGHSMGQNDRPFRGTGRLRVNNLDDDKLRLNFTTFKQYAKAGSPAEFVRDPERPGTNGFRETINPNDYVGGFNPPYTYADLNHVFLAKLGADGQVDEPSFVRRQALGTTDLSIYPGPLASFKDGAFDFNSPLWLDSNTEWKYRHVRPRKADHSQAFPDPGDAWGDVRNLPWGTHNDAVWIDLGVTPKTAPSGKKYKPLFAFTVLDLDGRVNLNAHGNLNGNNDQTSGAVMPTTVANHSSRSGAGPWEVSLKKAFDEDLAWEKVLRGSDPLKGRFTADGLPSNVYRPLRSAFLPLPVPRTHSPVDYNASTERGGANSLFPLPMPGSIVGGVGGWTYSPFGYFQGDVFGGASAPEITTTGADTDPIRHAAGFNPFVDLGTTPGNRLFSHEHFGKLLGRQTRNATAFQDSDLWKLGLFKSSPFVSSGRDTRFDRITTMSWDMDRPGAVPYVQDRFTQALTLNPGPGFAGGIRSGTDYPATASTNISYNPTWFSASGEADSSYQADATLARFKRLNLHRLLTDYGTLDARNGKWTGKVSQADNDRRNFAGDLLQALCAATGALTPDELVINSITESDQRFKATRWLAQLAVNMVDQFDSDEVMTIWNWTTRPAAWMPTTKGDDPYIVVGHELPRLVLNEVYAQVENKDGAERTSTMAPTEFKLQINIELLNPLLLNPGSTDDHSAILKGALSDSVHVLTLARPSLFKDNGWVNPGTNYGSVNSIDASDLIDPDNEHIGWVDKMRVGPSGDKYDLSSDTKSMQSGYVAVGPDAGVASDLDSDSKWNAGSITSNDSGYYDAAGFKTGNRISQPKLTVKLDKSLSENLETSITGTLVNDVPVILLRRLANPGKPHNSDYTNADFNPYITIDTFQITPKMLKENDARKKIVKASDPSKSDDNTASGKGFITADKRKSYGKAQPYFWLPKDVLGADFGYLVPQDPDPATTPKTTFLRTNVKKLTSLAGYLAPGGGSDFETPRLMSHLDRPPVSIGEILTIPTCRTHEYALLNNAQAQYCSGWLDPNTRLHRFLELVQAGNTRLATVYYDGPRETRVVSIGYEGGRIPGKINLNTCSKEVFLALCDQNIANRFTPAQLNNIWDQIVSRRPFWGFGVGGYDGSTDLLGGFDPSGTGTGPTVTRGLSQSLLLSHPAGDDKANDPANPWSLLIDYTHGKNNGDTYPAINGTARTGTNGAVEIPPAVRLELFNKIVGNSTTRSNCFAVWLTVGFFEVVSEDGIEGTYSQKYILGKELQPRTRKRFFSLVDRTQLEAWRTTVDNGIITGPVQLSNLGLGTSFTSPITGKKHPITAFQPAAGGGKPAVPATVLTISPGTLNEETVEVEYVLDSLRNPVPGIQLKNKHVAPIVICNRGNPGPIPSKKVDLDDWQKQGLIPYFQVLE